MLSTTQIRKAKITLSDYAYRQDIESRIFMAHLSVFEVTVLQEIVHHSLKISIEEFANELDISTEILIPILHKLSASKLYKRDGMTLLVDKDMRKYFEFQLEKFNENFKPDLEFLQSVLNKVPIHVLPLWYLIPRSSNNIFASIIEKYFSTPKVFRQHLSELEFDNPVLSKIIYDVYHAPGFKVKAADLMAKYNLSRECFEESLLLLEYHFACCLSYNQIDDYWEEVVTPFFEIHEYLNFEAEAKPLPIVEPIKKSYFTDFNFINDLTTLLQACQSKKSNLLEVKNLRASEKELKKQLVDKLLQVDFIKSSPGGQYSATDKGKTWLAKTLHDKIANLGSDPLNILSNAADFAHLWNVRNLHLVEKKLRHLAPNQWIEFDHFLKGFIAPLGDKEPVTLKNKGTKWKYVVPTYTAQEKHFIETVIMRRLAELGVVNTGSHQGKACFCLTAFGHHFIH